MTLTQWITQTDLSISTWAASLGWSVEGLLRMLVAVTAGGAVGMEREIRGRVAGLRTHALVALGSALAMIVSVSFAKVAWQHPSGNFNINIDPSRIAYSVMSGVGFLGAGVILHHRGTVRGLTTAAALWCVAALGLCAGFGLYLETCFAAIVVVTVLWIIDYLEKRIPKWRYKEVTLRLAWTNSAPRRAIDFMKSAGFRVHETGFTRHTDKNSADLYLRVSHRNKSDIDRLLTEANAAEGIEIVALGSTAH